MFLNKCSTPCCPPAAKENKNIFPKLQALAPAAKACSGGRLYLYALAAGGQAGVERALEKYKAELVRDMKLMGCTKISDLNRSNLRFRK